MQPQAAPIALSSYYEAPYEAPPEFHEDIFGPAALSFPASSFPAFSNYEALPDFGEVTASLLSRDQGIPMHEFPRQHLGMGMGMQPSSALWSAQPLPSLLLPFNAIEVSVSNTHHLIYNNSFLQRTNSIASISDGISDAHTHWSGSISQQSIISPTTTNPRRQRTKNPKQIRPALRDYQGTDEHDILVVAKESFTATAFSTGLFFYHKHSCHLNQFRTMSRDVFTYAAQQKGRCKSFKLHYHYYCTYTIIFS